MHAGSNALDGIAVTVSVVKIMVTGHRSLNHADVVAASLGVVLNRHLGAVAISGGAGGADSVWATVAVEAGAEVEIYLPNQFYLQRYPNSIDQATLRAATCVHTVVERPDVGDWRTRWDAERWWRDNHARNAAMVAASDLAVVVSARHPRVLAGEPKGGTAQCVKLLARGGSKVVWVPDAVGGAVRWVQL
jgi:hypothetical protein